jgi:hypothetical protein
MRRYPCYICNQPFPRDQLQYNRIWAGYQGRPKTGRVLMCADCSAQVDEHWRKQEEMQKAMAIVGLIIMSVICLVFYAIRGY